ncbi:MAG: TIGR00296 family protein [Candidatus Aenigmatarchaeota archaeon]
MLSLDQGRELVKIARKAVETRKVDKNFSKDFKIKKGVFVTIETYPEKELRGCIGFPYPTFPLGEAVQKAAISAAFEDPRFEPLEREELSRVIFEVSILTEPELIEVKNPKEYFEKIEAGKDGLILQNGPFTGLFLPQVWDHFKTKQEFLENLCFKAGLTPDYIYDKRTKIFKFKVQIFAEEKPNGKIVEIKRCEN